MWFPISITAICLVIALKGRFAAKPFITLSACLAGMLAGGYYLGLVAPVYDALPWLSKWIVWLVVAILFGFVWLFFRSLEHLNEISQKNKQIADDLRKKFRNLLDEIEEYRQKQLDRDQDE